MNNITQMNKGDQRGGKIIRGTVRDLLLLSLSVAIRPFVSHAASMNFWPNGRIAMRLEAI